MNLDVNKIIFHYRVVPLTVSAGEDSTVNIYRLENPKASVMD